MPAIQATSTGVLIDVWVVPGSSRTAIQGLHGDRIKITVAVPAEGGRVNRAAADLLSETLGTKVDLKTGMRSRSKVFEVPNGDIEDVRRRLGIWAG